MSQTRSDNRATARQAVGAAHRRRALVWVIVIALSAMAGAGIYMWRRAEAPLDDDGFLSMRQTMAVNGEDGAALTGVAVESQGEETLITLSFAGATPSCGVSCLIEPARLVIDMERLSSWPLALGVDCGEGGLCAGGFRSLAARGDALQMIFQMRHAFGFYVESAPGALIAHVIPVAQALSSGYFVTYDAYEAVSSGDRPVEGMTPALCDDGGITLISGRFETRVEAENFAGRLPDIAPGVTPEVVQLSDGDAPPAQGNETRAALERARVYLPSGDRGSARLWVQNGQMLCYMPDRQRALFAVYSAGAQDGMGEYCELWLYDASGRGQRLIDVEFRDVTRARFSADGALLAFLENTGTERRLYCYAIAQKRLTDVSELAGGGVYGFDFDAEGLLYFVGGSALQLARYDPASSGEGAVRLVEDAEGLLGDLVAGSADWTPGMIFMTDGENAAYSFDTAAGKRRYLTGGGRLLRSPGGRYLLAMQYGGEGDAIVSLAAFNLTTNQPQTIAPGESVIDACWSPDGTEVYYLLSNGENDPEYPYRLYRHTILTGDSVFMGLSAAGEIDTGAVDDELIFSLPWRGADGRTRLAAYRVALN